MAQFISREWGNYCVSHLAKNMRELDENGGDYLLQSPSGERCYDCDQPAENYLIVMERAGSAVPSA